MIKSLLNWLLWCQRASILMGEIAIIELWWIMLMVSNGSTIFAHTPIHPSNHPIIIDIWWMNNGANCLIKFNPYELQNFIWIFLFDTNFRLMPFTMEMPSEAFRELELFSNLSNSYENFHLLPNLNFRMNLKIIRIFRFDSILINVSLST